MNDTMNDAVIITHEIMIITIGTNADASVIMVQNLTSGDSIIELSALLTLLDLT
jgi:hypothetical protein